MRLKNANIQLQKPTVYYTSQNSRKPKKPLISAKILQVSSYFALGQIKKDPSNAVNPGLGSVLLRRRGHLENKRQEQGNRDKSSLLKSEPLISSLDAWVQEGRGKERES